MRKKKLCLFIVLFFIVNLNAIQDDVDIEKGQLLQAPKILRSEKITTQQRDAVIFTESFEDGQGAWQTYGEWQIGSPNSGPYSGYDSYNCAATNLDSFYVDYADDWLISPEIYLENASDIKLYFWEWLEIESGYDTGNVMIQTVGASAWTQLATSTGTSDWRETIINLTAYSGETVKIGFNFVSDNIYNYPGWYVDEIRIETYEYAPLSANISSLNSQNFPFVYMNVVVDSFGVGTPYLTQDDFSVFENGSLQTDYFEVTPPDVSGGSRRADIVFLVDNSGSMDSYQNAVANNVYDFVDNLVAGGVDFALGLCRFGATENGGYPIMEDNGILTQDQNYFKNDIWQRNVISGGFEPGWDALYQSATNFSFRPGTQKIFILITDESVTGDANQGNYTQNQALNILQDNSITTFSLIELDSSSIQDYGTIAENTNGAYFDIFSPFDDILDYISAQVSNTYLVRYRSNDSNFNGITRNVDVNVSYFGEQATASSSYMPGAAPQIVRTASTIALHQQTWPENTPLTIEVEISDQYEPFTQSATLYYKNTEDESYNSIAMIQTGIVRNEIWEATIPPEDVQANGVDYYITATDGQSTSSNPSVQPSTHPYQIAVLPNVAPFIQHTPLDTYALGSDILIEANVSDSTNYVESVLLNYRKVGQLTYQETEMDVTEGNYMGIIPGDFVTIDGIEYYISAQDDYGVSSYHGYADEPHQILIADATFVGGTVSGNWTLDDSPYYVTDSLLVPQGEMLMIESDVEVIFLGDYSLIIAGILNAQNVIFKSYNDNYFWQGIIFNPTSENSFLAGCELQNALLGISLNDVAITIQNCLINIIADEIPAGSIGLHLYGIANPLIDNTDILYYNKGMIIKNNSMTESTPTLTNLRIKNSTNSTRTDQTGIEIEDQVIAYLENVEVEDYSTGLSISGNEEPSTSTTLSNIRIKNSTNSTREISEGIIIKNKNVNVDSLDIENYPNGFIFVDSLDAEMSITLTNIRIKNSTNSTREDNAGLTIFGDGETNLTDCEIEDYDNGLTVDGGEQASGSITLENIRIKNSTNSTREVTNGITIKNSTVTVDSLDIENYPNGFIFVDSLDAEMSITLTNIRIKNSTNSTREDNAGLTILGDGESNLTDCEIEDYDNGLTVDGGEQTSGSITLENIRIKNSTNSTRTDQLGLSLSGGATPNLNDIEIENYSFGVNIIGNGQPAMAAPVLSNIRIKNSTNSTRENTAGMKIKDLYSAEINNLQIEDYSNALVIEDSTTTRASITLTNLRIKNSTNSTRNGNNGVKFFGNINADIIGSEIVDCDTAFVFTGNGQSNIEYSTVFVNDSTRTEAIGIYSENNNINVDRTTFYSIENGVVADNSDLEFNNSIIWNDSPLANPIISNGLVNVENSDIAYAAGTYPGNANLNHDPNFIDTEITYTEDQIDLHLRNGSICLQNEIGALEFPDEVIANPEPYSPGWKLMGVPVTLEWGHSNPVDVFADDITPFYASPYYTSILTYNPDNNTFATPDSIKLGEGYWLNISEDNTFVDAVGFVDEDPLTLNLPGAPAPSDIWHLVANPFDTAITFNDNIVLNQISNYGYIYDPVINNYDVIFGDSPLQAWQGMFVKSTDPNAWMTFNYPTIGTTGGNREQNEMWEIALSVSQLSNEKTRVRFFAGAAENAANEYDPEDIPTLPALPFIPQFTNISLTAQHDDWGNNSGEYTRDIQAWKNHEWSWQLKLATDETVLISAESLKKIPEEYSIFLKNHADGSVVNLREESLIVQFTEVAGGGGKKSRSRNEDMMLELMIGPNLDPTIVPDVSECEFALSQNYPNPFNPETKISFSVPQEDQVKLTIYNIRGQKVRTLINDEIYEIGQHSIIWNGQDNDGKNVASGVYFYKISYQDKIRTKRMLLLK